MDFAPGFAVLSAAAIGKALPMRKDAAKGSARLVSFRVALDIAALGRLFLCENQPLVPLHRAPTSRHSRPFGQLQPKS